MLALALVLCAVVLLLGVLVAGLLRSHADILKALHDLGVGVGDPSADDSAPRQHPVALRRHDGVGHRTGPSEALLTVGPPLPGERNSTSAASIGGISPSGDALGFAPGEAGDLTLLAFLSSGCATCGAFWAAFRRPDRRDLLEGVRLIVVTKGPEMEIPADLRALAPTDLPVVMSSQAWDDYEVPGSPFFVLVDGRAGRRVGEGIAQGFAQVADLVRRARVEAGLSPATTQGRAFAEGLDGPARELANDRELMGAGIMPGDASLYPASLTDIFEPGRPPVHSRVEPPPQGP